VKVKMKRRGKVAMVIVIGLLILGVSGFLTYALNSPLSNPKKKGDNKPDYSETFPLLVSGFTTRSVELNKNEHITGSFSIHGLLGQNPSYFFWVRDPEDHNVLMITNQLQGNFSFIALTSGIYEMHIYFDSGNSNAQPYVTLEFTKSKS